MSEQSFVRKGRGLSRLNERRSPASVTRVNLLFSLEGPVMTKITRPKKEKETYAWMNHSQRSII